MTKIITDFVGNESLEVTQSRITEIVEYYLGSTALDSVVNWGDVRILINSIDPASATISGTELAGSFLPKLNTLNTPGDINNFGAYTASTGETPSLVLDFTFGAYGKDDLASFDKYTVGDEEPSLVLDFTEAQYGRST